MSTPTTSSSSGEGSDEPYDVLVTFQAPLVTGTVEPITVKSCESCSELKAIIDEVADDENLTAKGRVKCFPGGQTKFLCPTDHPLQKSFPGVTGIEVKLSSSEQSAAPNVEGKAPRQAPDRRPWKPSTVEKQTAYFLCKALYCHDPVHSLNSDYQKHTIDEVHVATDKGCMVAISKLRQEIWIAFRGTNSWKDFWTDVCVLPRSLGNGEVHMGFLSRVHEYIHYSILRSMVQRQEYRGFNVRVTGHSMGAACAQLLTAEVLLQQSPELTQSSAPQLSQPVAPRLACIAFATPFWASEEVRLLIFHNKWDYLLCSIVNNEDCVPGLTSLQGSLSANLQSAVEIANVLEKVPVPFLQNAASCAKAVCKGINSLFKISDNSKTFSYHPVGVYDVLFPASDPGHSNDCESRQIFASNRELRPMLVASSSIKRRSVTAHGLEAYYTNLMGLGEFGKTIIPERTPNAIVNSIELLLPKIQTIEGVQTRFQGSEYVKCMTLTIKGDFVFPYVHDKSKLRAIRRWRNTLPSEDVNGFEIAKVIANSDDSSRFSLEISSPFLLMRNSLPFTLVTPWGKHAHDILASSINSNVCMTRSEILHGSLVPQVFANAFLRSVLIEGRNATERGSQLLRESLCAIDHDVQETLKKGKRGKTGNNVSRQDSFQDAFREYLQVDEPNHSGDQAEKINAALEKADDAAVAACYVISSGFKLTPKPSWWKTVFVAAGGVLIVCGIACLGFVIIPATAGAATAGAATAGVATAGVATAETAMVISGTAGAATAGVAATAEGAAVISGLAGAATAAGVGCLVGGLIPSRIDWEQSEEMYRTLLKFLLSNLGTNVDMVDTKKIYRLEGAIDHAVSEKLRRHDAKSLQELGPSSVFNDPHKIASIQLKMMVKETQRDALEKLLMIQKVYRVRQQLISQVFVSVMGPHNVGKTTFVKVLADAYSVPSGTLMEQRTTNIACSKLSPGAFLLDTPGFTDPCEAAASLAHQGIRSNLVILLFRARSVAEPEMRLLREVRKISEKGGSFRVYVTHADEESDLTEEGINRRRADYAKRLDCMESEFKYVSFSNNAGPGGQTCAERSHELRCLNVLDAADVVEDLLQYIQESRQAQGAVWDGMRTHLQAKLRKLKDLRLSGGNGTQGH